ncbi:hypothetical protein GN316_18195 [Xylophilus sp. Kf1]|nr:hypothetical protein [Xylophilus sp. Kf1]
MSTSQPILRRWRASFSLFGTSSRDSSSTARPPSRSAVASTVRSSVPRAAIDSWVIR